MTACPVKIIKAGRNTMEIPWVIDEHTRVKHELLKNYIGTWMAIMFSQQVKIRMKPQLLFLDGFAGPGIYYEDDTKSLTCKGSPLIVGDCQ
jgi:three-Cys-motif partner protein